MSNTNYTFAQVVKIYAENTDKEAMIEIGRKFPLLAAYVCKLIALAGPMFVEFASMMPEHITANKLNKAITAAGGASGETEADTEETTEDAEEADGDEDLSSKTTKELYNLCIKKGLKVSKYGKPKSYYIEALTGGAEEAEEEEEEETEEEQENQYDGKTAPELFKMCKSRGIKAAPKKPAKYYIDLLTKADEEAEDDTDGEDDWVDDDAEETEENTTAKNNKGAKTTSKGAKAGGNKTAKTSKAAKVEDDDEDWDL